MTKYRVIKPFSQTQHDMNFTYDYNVGMIIEDRVDILRMKKHEVMAVEFLEKQPKVAKEYLVPYVGE